MHYLQKQIAHKTRNKCTKSKNTKKYYTSDTSLRCAIECNKIEGIIHLRDDDNKRCSALKSSGRGFYFKQLPQIKCTTTKAYS